MSSGARFGAGGWEVVRVIDLSPSRRRLELVSLAGEKRHVVIDAELDDAAHRAKIADALDAERFRVATTRGPEDRPPTQPSPWITT